MKFLILTISLSSGGAERQLLFCARMLVELGHQVTIITFRASQPNARMRELKTSVEAYGATVLERNEAAAYGATFSHIRANPCVIVWAWGLRCALYTKLLTTPLNFRLLVALMETSPGRMKKFAPLERWRAQRVALYLNNSHAATRLLSEALALGRYAVSTPVGDVPWIAEHVGAVTLVDADAPAQVCDAITRLRANWDACEAKAAGAGVNQN